MKILLTGSTGFIGSHFLRLAVQRGHEVAGLVSPGKVLPPNLATEKATWLRGTLEDAPWDAITAFKPDVCVHAAWITTPGVYLESPENLRFLESSKNFLTRVADLGTNHIVGIGTCVEYQISGEPLSEEKTPIAPTTLYARCKNELRLAMEAEANARNLRFCWARVFYPYGPGEHPSRLCSSIIGKLSRGEKIVLKTPDSTKDYIYIDDLASALLTVVEKKFAGAINLGTGVGISVREIAQTIAAEMGKAGLVSEQTPADKDPFGYVVAKANRLRSFGWHPATSIKQGLHALLQTVRDL